jgi:hypothetical protein
LKKTELSGKKKHGGEKKKNQKKKIPKTEIVVGRAALAGFHDPESSHDSGRILKRGSILLLVQ